MNKLFLLATLLLPTTLFAQTFPSDQIQKALDKSVDNKRIFGAVFSVNKGGETHHFASGNMNVGDAYYIASVSKLYTAAVLFKLVDQKKLSLDDPIKQYLTNETLSGLHVYEGEEYSNNITIRHLVTNTSGLSDYFTQEDKDKESLLDRLVSNGDTALSFDQLIEMTKALPAQFPPGTEGKAYYSDGNYQLLGKIINNVTGKSMEEVYEEYIFDPLDLEQTYLFSDLSDTTPAPFYYKKEVLKIPKMMTSFQSDGGIVSTAEENLIFLKAHLNGELFSAKNTDVKRDWNKIYSPFQYGYGIMKFKFFGMPDMIGHAGANGSFAYYIPSKDVYITGTVNQIDKPQLVYKLIGKILSKID